MTTINLVAWAPDGWAICDDGSAKWLLRPPYRDSDRDRISEYQFSRSLAEEDFEFVERQFAGWGELVKAVENHLDEEFPTSESEAHAAALSILSRATADQAAEHVAELREMQGSVRKDRFEQVLVALLKSPGVKNDRTLGSEIVALLEASQVSARPEATHSGRASEWGIKDEHRVRRYGSGVRRRGRPLVPHSVGS